MRASSFAQMYYKLKTKQKNLKIIFTFYILKKTKLNTFWNALVYICICKVFFKGVLWVKGESVLSLSLSLSSLYLSLSLSTFYVCPATHWKNLPLVVVVIVVAGTIAPSRDLPELSAEDTIRIILSNLNLVVPVVAALLVIIIAIIVICILRSKGNHHKGIYDPD